MSRPHRASQDHAYRPEIDGLRAIAVLMVIAYHFDERLVSGGFLGVDLFFVISGYVVSASLATHLERHDRRLLLSFYTRRVKRLLPALLLCALTTGTATSLLCHSPRQSILTGASSMAGLSGLALWIKGKDYFAVGQQLNTFTHTWSLGVEEQFYLIFPWLMLATLARPHRALKIFGWLALLSLVGFAWMSTVDASAAFYFMPFRMWELCAGALIWATQRHFAPSPKWPPSALRPLAAQVSVLLVTFAVPFVHVEKSSVQTIAAVGLFALTLHVLDTPGPSRTVLASRPLVYVGRLSYSLYLWHWCVISLWMNVFGTKQPTPLLLALTALLAVSSYHLIENPLRRTKWFTDDDGGSLKVIGTGLACAGTCAAFLVLLIKLQPTVFLGDSRYLGLRSFLLDNPCHLLKEEEGTERCLSTRGRGPALYILGDSHSGNMLMGIRIAAERRGFEIAYLTDRTYNDKLVEVPDCGDNPCPEDDMGKRLIFLEKVLEPEDVVIFSLSRDRLFGEVSFDYPHRVPDPVLVASMNLRLRRLAEKVAQVGARLVFVEDIPKVCSELEFATAAFADDACRTSRQRSLMDRLPLSRLYRDIGASNPSVEVIDPHDIYCEGETCSNLLGSELLYVDASPHLTSAASEKAASLFACLLPPTRSEDPECRHILASHRHRATSP